MVNAASEILPAQTSLLLGLPPELRNHIYEYVACADEPHLALSRVVQPDLTLGRTCHQIRKELLAVFTTFLKEQAPCLHVQVQDFDFTNLVRLAQNFRSQVVSTNAEEEKEGKKPRQLNVELYLSKTAGDANLDGLETWLQLCSSCDGLKGVERFYYPAIFDWAHHSVDSVSALEARLVEEVSAYAAQSDWVGIARAMTAPRLQRRLATLEEELSMQRAEGEVLDRRLERTWAVLVKRMKWMRKRRRRQQFVARRGVQEAGEGVVLKGRRYVGLLGP